MPIYIINFSFNFASAIDFSSLERVKLVAMCVVCSAGTNCEGGNGELCLNFSFVNI